MVDLLHQLSGFKLDKPVATATATQEIVGNVTIIAEYT